MYSLYNNLVQKKPKIAVYTAIYGGKDNLRPLTNKDKDVDYFCFTDDSYIHSEGYKIVRFPSLFEDPSRNAKIFKVLPHAFFSNYDYAVWVDGNVDILVDNLRRFIYMHLADNDIALFSHPWRNCIYDEAQACIDLQKDVPKIIQRQIKKYEGDGYPRNIGLIAGGIILRRNNSQNLIQLNNAWWEEIVKHSKRDQLSFNYVAWKLGVSYSIIKGNVFDNQYFKVNDHVIK